MLFKVTGIVVRSSKDGDLAIVKIFDCLADSCTLRVKIWIVFKLNAVTLTVQGPETLTFPVTIMRDEVVGGLKNRFCWPIVLFKLDDLRLLEDLFEVQNELAPCSAESIDHLVVITYTSQLITFWANQKLKPYLLVFVKILDFINQNMLELHSIVVKDILSFLE